MISRYAGGEIWTRPGLPRHTRSLLTLALMVALNRGDILASAGVSSLADIAAVRTLGCAGAIVGRTIYEGRLNLTEAVRFTAEASGTP